MRLIVRLQKSSAQMKTHLSFSVAALGTGLTVFVWMTAPQLNASQIGGQSAAVGAAGESTPRAVSTVDSSIIVPPEPGSQRDSEPEAARSHTVPAPKPPTGRPVQIEVRP